MQRTSGEHVLGAYLVTGAFATVPERNLSATTSNANNNRYKICKVHTYILKKYALALKN